MSKKFSIGVIKEELQEKLKGVTHSTLKKKYTTKKGKLKEIVDAQRLLKIYHKLGFTVVNGVITPPHASLKNTKFVFIFYNLMNTIQSNGKFSFVLDGVKYDLVSYWKFLDSIRDKKLAPKIKQEEEKKAKAKAKEEEKKTKEKSEKKEKKEGKKRRAAEKIASKKSKSEQGVKTTEATRIKNFEAEELREENELKAQELAELNRQLAIAERGEGLLNPLAVVDAGPVAPLPRRQRSGFSQARSTRSALFGTADSEEEGSFTPTRVPTPPFIVPAQPVSIEELERRRKIKERKERKEKEDDLERRRAAFRENKRAQDRIKKAEEARVKEAEEAREKAKEDARQRRRKEISKIASERADLFKREEDVKRKESLERADLFKREEDVKRKESLEIAEEEKRKVVKETKRKPPPPDIEEDELTPDEGVLSSAESFLFDQSPGDSSTEEEIFHPTRLTINFLKERLDRLIKEKNLTVDEGDLVRRRYNSRFRDINNKGMADELSMIKQMDIILARFAAQPSPVVEALAAEPAPDSPIIAAEDAIFAEALAVEQVDNVGLQQVPQELDFEMQDLANDDQLFQMENQAAQIVLNNLDDELQEQGDANRANEEAAHEIEIVEVGNDDVLFDVALDIDLERNEELAEGNPFDAPLLDDEDEGLTPNKIRRNRLEELNELLKVLTAQINENEDTVHINQVLDEINEFIEVPGSLLAPPKSSDPIITSIRGLLRAIKRKITENDRRGRLLIARRAQKFKETEEKKRDVLDRRLRKTKLAITKIRKRVDNDGLIENDLGPTNQETKLIIDAVQEIEEDIRENGVGDDNINAIVEIFKLVGRDSLEVIRDVLLNNPFDLLSPGRAIAGPLLIRLLGRIAYNGRNLQDEELDANVHGLLDGRLEMEGVNRGLLDRFLGLMRFVIPRPPGVEELPERIPLEREVSPETQRRRNRNKSTLRQKLSQDAKDLLKGGVDKVKSQDFREDLRRFTANVNEEFNEQINTAVIRTFFEREEFEETSQNEIEIFIRNMSSLEIKEYSEWIQKVNRDSNLFTNIRGLGGRINPMTTLIEILRNGRISFTRRFREHVKRLRNRVSQATRRTPPTQAAGRNDEELGLFPPSGPDRPFVVRGDFSEIHGDIGEQLDPILRDGGEEFRGIDEDVEAQLNPVAKAAQAAATIAAFGNPTPVEEAALFESTFKSLLSKAGDLKDASSAVASEGVGRVAGFIAKNVLPVLRPGGGGGGGGGGGAPGQRNFYLSLLGIIVGALAVIIPISVAGAAIVQDSVFGGIERLNEKIKQESLRNPSRPTSTEFNKGVPSQVNPEDIDKPQGSALLRPEFNMLGTSYFDDKFGITPMDVENSEWADFNYVNRVDLQNNIEIDNARNQNMRFSGDLFFPDFVNPIKPPSRRAVLLTRSQMQDQIQLNQGFGAKFDNAFTLHDNLSVNRNRDVLPKRWNNNILYNPDTSGF